MNLLHWPQALGENTPLYPDYLHIYSAALPRLCFEWGNCVALLLECKHPVAGLCLRPPCPPHQEGLKSACCTPPSLTPSPSAHMSSSADHRWAVQNEEQTYLDVITKHSHSLQEVHWGLKPTTAPSLFPFSSQGGSRREREGTSSGKGQKESCRSFFTSVLTGTQSTNNACRDLSPFAQPLLFPQSILTQRVFFRCWCVYVKRGNSCDWNLMTAKYVLWFKNLAMLKGSQSISERMPVCQPK